MSNPKSNLLKYTNALETKEIMTFINNNVLFLIYFFIINSNYFFQCFDVMIRKDISNCH